MLEQLQFVMGAVGKKELLPGLTAVRIGNGCVQGFNGHLSLCAPLDTSLVCAPNALTLFNAVKQCNDAVHLSLTPTGKLSVRSGPFKALIDCVPGELPHVGPEGEYIALPGQVMLDAFRILEPFVSQDSHKPWAGGVLLRNGCAYATNNIVVLEYYHGAACPELNIPLGAVKQALRIGEAPTYAQASANSLTLYYADGRWMRTNLLSVQWPDVQAVLYNPNPHYPVDPLLFEAVRAVQPFTDAASLIYFHMGLLATAANADEAAGTYLVPSLQCQGIYNANHLLSLEGLADCIDWSPYPRPATFFGKCVRGAVIGVRHEA